MAINNLTISGNVGKDGELATTQSGQQILKFSVAATSGFGDKKKTSWVNCVMFGNYAGAMAQHITKGSKVCVSGEFTIEQWDKQDGTKGMAVSLNVRSMDLLGGGNGGGGQQQSQQGGWGQPQQPQQQQPQQRQQPQQQPTNFDDDIPF